MNNLEERKNEIANFFDIDGENARDKLIDELRAYAESKEEVALANEIRTNFEQINMSGISVMYEVLSKNPRKWSTFYKEEYERAFKSAEKSDNPAEILDTLEEICFVDANKLESRDEIILLLENYLSHKNAVMRYKAIWYLGDWIIDENKNQYSLIINKIVQKLVDTNWRIRYISKLFLADLNKLPKDFKFSFLDKLRIKYLNPLKIE